MCLLASAWVRASCFMLGGLSSAHCRMRCKEDKYSELHARYDREPHVPDTTDRHRWPTSTRHVPPCRHDPTTTRHGVDRRSSSGVVTAHPGEESDSFSCMGHSGPYLLESSRNMCMPTARLATWSEHNSMAPWAVNLNSCSHTQLLLDPCSDRITALTITAHAHVHTPRSQISCIFCILDR
jgi:hypothetical protein